MVKNLPAWVRKIPWRRKWQPTPVFLPGKSHGQRSLMGYRPWDCRVGHDWVINTFAFTLNILYVGPVSHFTWKEPKIWSQHNYILGRPEIPFFLVYTVSNLCLCLCCCLHVILLNIFFGWRMLFLNMGNGLYSWLWNCAVISLAITQNLDFL